MKQAIIEELHGHKALVDPDELRVAIDTSGFGAKALLFLQHVRFQQYEVEYKCRLASHLRKAQNAILNHESSWRELLRKAINCPEDNITNWRLREPFLGWCENDSDSVKLALEALWNTGEPINERVDAFAGKLVDAGIKQPGAQLCLISVLLMPSGWTDCPPVRAKVLSTAVEKLGLSTIPQDASVAERYALFMDILDSLIKFSQNYSRPLKNRLEAQGTVWCVTGGWRAISAEDISVTPPEFDEDAEKDILAAAHELESLGETERQAVVSARRGQGRYRNDLLNLWVNCAVTGCTVERLLRSSHLKPWKLSSNAERLNPFNGLLLTPNLDIALDRWLISFTDEGSILISSSLNAKDAVALGLHGGMKLQFVKPEHKPFLSYHREEFLKREHSLNG